MIGANVASEIVDEMTAQVRAQVIEVGTLQRAQTVVKQALVQ